MMFAAWFEFHRDPVIRRQHAAHIVYADLLSHPRCFYEPTPFKIYAAAARLGLKDESVIRALNLLVERGYLVECPRTNPHTTRAFTVCVGRLAVPSAPKWSSRAA